MKKHPNNTPNASSRKKKTTKKKATPQMKKHKRKLTRAQYDDLRQIDWFPVDPYAD